MANRYKELIEGVPRGSFYEAAGNIIPYRDGDSEFLFSPVTASRDFTIFVNDQIRGSVKSDISGAAIVRVHLDAGRQDVVIVDSITQERFIAYVTVRNYATVMAAHADVLDVMDTSIDEIQAALSLETANSRFIEDVYGLPLRQANDFGTWVTESYRKMLWRLRQAYRLWGAKLLGLRQAVHAYTSSLPMRLPKEWRPAWALGRQFMLNGDLQTRSWGTSSPLTNLNSQAPVFVHVAFGGAPLTFPGPFVNPPTPQVLTVTFSGAWNGGPVIVTGLDGQGAAVVESFTPTAPPETVTGFLEFASVTGATKGAGVAGTASIGLGTSRFVSLVSFGPYQAGAFNLTYLTSPDRLRWGLGSAPTFDISATSPLLTDGQGRITLRTTDRFALWYALSTDVGAGVWSSVAGTGLAVGEDRYLLLELDGKGPVLIDLADTNFSGGGTPGPAFTRTALQAAVTINLYFAREPAYGASRAYGYLSCPAGSAMPAGTKTFDLSDGIHPVITFRYRRTDLAEPVVPPYDIGVTSATSAASVATATAAIINAVLTDLRIAAGITGAGGGAVVGLVNNFGGTQGNVDISSTISATLSGAGFSALGMILGANSPVTALASIQTGSPAGFGTVLKFQEVNAALALTPPETTFKVHPLPGGAHRILLGEPHVSAPLTALLVAQGQSATIAPALAARFPTVDETVVLLGIVLDTSNVTAVTVALTHPSALELHFDSSWRVTGSLRVDGVAFGGAAQSETFVVPSNVVKTSTATATIGADPYLTGNTLVTLSGGDTTAGLTPGMFLRTSTGFGAYIRFIDTATQLRVYIPFVSGAFTWSVTQAQVVQGNLAFQSASQLVHLVPSVGGVIGSCGLTLIDAATRGYEVRVGRGLRQTGTGGTIIAPSLGFALFQDIGSILTELHDEGGYLLIRDDITNPANNGLHKIYNVAFGGIDVYNIKHQDADRGGTFVAGALPVGAVWRTYTPGELMRVVGLVRSTGTFAFLPQQWTHPHGATAIIEPESDMPMQTQGIEGPWTITVDVDRAVLPTATQTDSLLPSGTNVPDGWRLYNATLIAADEPGQLVPSRLNIVASGTDPFTIGTTDACLEKTLPPEIVEAYRGFDLRAAFWVQQHYSAAAWGSTSNFRVEFAFNEDPYLAASDVAVPVTFLDGVGLGGALDASEVSNTVRVPVDARTCRIRLRARSTVALDNFTVEKCVVIAPLVTGLGVGSSTVPYSEHAAKFGEVLYVWSYEPLNANEIRGLGLPVSGSVGGLPAQEGTIDRVVNAHGIWQRYDVSEYSGGEGLNVRGVYTEAEWLGATLTNMQVIVGTPARTTSVRPTDASLVQGEVLTVVAPSDATVAETSIHESVYPNPPADGEVLYQDGVPVPSTSRTAVLGDGDSIDMTGTTATLTDADAVFSLGVVGQTITVAGSANPMNDGTFVITARPSATTVQWTNAIGIDDLFFTGTYRINSTSPWRFTAAATVRIASVAAGDSGSESTYTDGAPYFDATSEYTIDYNRMIRAEPAPFDLPASSDYLWFIDASIYRRAEPDGTPTAKVESLTFGGDYRATLRERSDGIQTNMSLVKDTGLVREELSVSEWSIVDTATIEIDAASFDSNAIYVLTYQAQVPTYPRPARVVIQHRSGATSGATLAQPWRIVEVDQQVAWAAFHQLRVTCYGVTDVRDVEIMGLGVRGIRLYGSAPYAPGILTP